MFDFDVGKLLLVGIVALIFIPPKDLPQALRQLGKLMGQARRMATDFRAQFDEALRDSELHELKDEFNQLKQKTSVEGAMNRIADMIEVDPASKIDEEHAELARQAYGKPAEPATVEPTQADKTEPEKTEPEKAGIEISDLRPPPAPDMKS